MRNKKRPYIFWRCLVAVASSLFLVSHWLLCRCRATKIFENATKIISN